MPDLRLTCPGCWGKGYVERGEDRFHSEYGHHEGPVERTRCELCGGRGYVGPVGCPECEDGDVQGVCRNCDGAGETPSGSVCTICMGSGVGEMADCSACEGVGLVLETPKGRKALPRELRDELGRRGPCNVCGHSPCRCSGEGEPERREAVA